MIRTKKPNALALSRQAKSLAMETASRTPPTRVHKILSNGREARALTSTITPSTATLSLAMIATTTSRVASSALRQPISQSDAAEKDLEIQHSPSSSVMGVITSIAALRTTSSETLLVCSWSSPRAAIALTGEGPKGVGAA